MVNISEIHTPDFQRGIFEKHPIRAQGYDESREGSITVAYYDRRMWVLDGQQRVSSKIAAMEERPDLSPRIHATVLYGLTWEEMAQEFVRLNADRKGITAYDTYRAGVSAELPEYLMVKEAVESVGWRVAKSTGIEKFAAIAPALRSVVEDENNHRLTMAVSILNEAFPGQKTNSRIVEGLLDYLALDRARTITPAYMAKKLQQKFHTTTGAYNALVEYANGRAERHVGKHFLTDVFGLQQKKPLRAA